jgi:L-glyceraldehyde 3-phosphate reductase
MGALDAAVRQGKALYVGVSSYRSERTAQAAAILRDLGTPCVIHQPSYSMLNRWTEEDRLLDTLEAEGIGCIAFSPLAQGLLTGKYLEAIPGDSRARAGKSFRAEFLAEQTLARVRALNDIARRRGQSLAQMAVGWVLRDPRMTSALIGASRVEQIEEIMGAVGSTEFSEEELREIDRYATDSDINIWQQSSRA